ncbi:MAG: LamG-like jellyroll fold domain-containing protein [Bacteroidota bacterium]
MKKFKFIQFLMIALISGSLITFTACDDDDDDDVQVDKTELEAKIVEAEDLIENSVEGMAEGQYAPGSKADLQEAIDLARAVYEDENATQAQVDNTVVNLTAAIEAFEGQLVTPIAPEDLVGHWTFDEGAGEQAMDFSGNDFHGLLSTGHAHWGAGTPEWTTDRYGNENQALYFNSGANVEVPFNAQLNPSQAITISLWMKPDTQDEPWANNYMVSLNRWNGYKLQLQDAPKVFFTMKALHEGNEVYHDRDNESPTINLGEWYHVAITFKDGEMAFYLDGTLVKLWDNTPGTPIQLDTPVGLTIGQDLPTDIYSDDDTSPYYVNWGGYFMGVLDEVRIYSSALTDTQVQSIYELEKP